jgi:nitrous oxidase accessory protein NosD/nitrous oxide reductase accessory protein NosL
MNAPAVLASLFAVLLVASSAFVVDAGAQRPDPVPFDDTITMGLTAAATVEARTSDYVIPQAEVFYSGYRYVVGYYSVEALVGELNRPGQERQFGQPLAVYVSDFSRAQLSLTEEGYLRKANSPSAYVGWAPAEEAHFVVGSGARVPGGGAAMVPFANRSAARTFAAEYGGEIRNWEAVRAMDIGATAATRERMRATMANWSTEADRRVAATRGLLDRPVSVVLGKDAPTLEAAVEQAAPNTTVLLPPGEYDANVTVSKPLTIRGTGSRTVLNAENATAITARSPAVAVADLRVVGVGNATSPDVHTNGTDEGDWDYRIQLGYGYGDAGVALLGANGSLVTNVSVDTPANGILVRGADDVVVDRIRVRGPDKWDEGFMGVMVMDSRVVVQRSTFVGGRDGVYAHLGEGTVVRDNRMTGMRFGVHLMYTSETLMQNNTVRDTSIGVVVMTRPTRNLLVGNDVRDSYTGINVAGSDSYVAENVVAGNRYGFQTPSKRSLYEQNTVVGNEIGVRASSLIPTDRIVANDVVSNDRPVLALLGPLQVWTGETGGNYWGPVPGTDRDGDGFVDRAFRPTDPVDRRVGQVAGAETLARSPAVTGVHALEAVLPGLQNTGVIDLQPRTRPVRPETLAAVNTTERAEP